MKTKPIYRSIAMLNVILFLICALFTVQPWYFLMLTAAQLIYVPLILHLIMKNEGGWLTRSYPYVGIPAFLAVAVLQLTEQTPWDTGLAFIYLAFTCVVALYGFTRFLCKGFTQLEEFSINMGMIYLAIGGAWFVAHVTGINTGFSPIMTWLTGIHFHYAAFLLLVFVGFLGRRYSGRYYREVCSLLLISPIIVALGITFSVWLELLSVLVYIVGIGGVIYLSWKASFDHPVQKWLVRISFAALAVSITFSFVYALGNVWGVYSITIHFMLWFHGIVNSVLFALLGVVGWLIKYPHPRAQSVSFPVSRIRGKAVIGERILQRIRTETRNERTGDVYSGLVDSMKQYEPDIDVQTCSEAIIDFYEHTSDYHLFAEVKWQTWFKPFAAVYRGFSRVLKQLNLPLSSERVEMTGDIYPIQDELDGRERTRAWVRMVKGEVVFIALYSSHQSKGRSYMNIALPLPWCSMIGILTLHQAGKQLYITSKRERNKDSDAGIYLAFHKNVFKLPLEEQFHLQEAGEGMGKGNLSAKHKMWICSLPFLTIDYTIVHREDG